MPRFEPFAGLRYASDGGDFDHLVAPPYDVIEPDERARLESRSPYNAVRVELPRDPGPERPSERDRTGPERPSEWDVEDGAGWPLDRYTQAARLLEAWRADGTLIREATPAFYLYRMTFTDELGGARTSSGVLGALELMEPDAGDVLPHERTMAKDKADRLHILQATRTNLSPIWGLSMSAGLSKLCRPDGPATARATDDDGVVHELWVVDDPRQLAAISAEVASAPVVIADGHHRFEVGLAYHAAHPADDGAGLILALVVELAPDQLDVRPIHRLISGLPPGFDLRSAWGEHFETGDFTGDDLALLAAMEREGALGLVTVDGRALLVPTAATDEAAEHDLDTARVEVARAALPPHELTFQAGVAEARAAVESGQVDAAVLVRPATVAQIRATGELRQRMPQKTTFFWPKPRTGMVFRTLD